MPRVRFTKRSRPDFNEIYDRIAEGSPRAAQSMIDRTVDRSSKLRDQPLSRHPRKDLYPGLRSVQSDRFLTLHEVVGDRMIASHLVHHARNVPVIVGRPPSR